MPPSHLKAITLTHVRYPRGDQIGHFLAWISLIPVFISLGGFVSHIIFRRELQTMFFALGLLISQIISETTKHAVRQSRPATCELLESCDSHGWPSSHSQYMFFFATYLTLLTVKGLGGALLTTEKTKWALCSWQWALAVLTMYSRVYLGYHSICQVYSGAGMGIVLGAAWFWVVNNVIFHYFPAIEESSVGKMFYIKDTTHIPNVLKFEYDNARASRKNLQSSKAD